MQVQEGANQTRDRTTAINNVKIVTEDTIITSGSVVIEGSKIVAIRQGGMSIGDVTINGCGCWLLPGFIDIHGDSLENAIAPRPAAPFPLEYILPAFDAELSVHGITTMYYCVAMADLGEGLTKPMRYRDQVIRIIEAVNRFRPRARVRTRIHLRYEILDVDSLEIIHDLIRRHQLDLVSIMDHTPGYGVFKNIEAYRQYRKRSGGSLKEANEEIEQRFRLRENVDNKAVEGLIQHCHEQEIPTASHDDHTAEKVGKAAEMGIGIAEFPVSTEAAEAAGKFGMQTVFGAANLVRDQSHAGNVLASDMIRKGFCDIVCSDYSPMAMLQGLFKAGNDGRISFAELVRLFSLHPSEALGIDRHTGSIRTGKLADLILVRKDRSVPRVEATFIEGQQVFRGNAIS